MKKKILPVLLALCCFGGSFLGSYLNNYPMVNAEENEIQAIEKINQTEDQNRVFENTNNNVDKTIDNKTNVDKATDTNTEENSTNDTNDLLTPESIKFTLDNSNSYRVLENNNTDVNNQKNNNDFQKELDELTKQNTKLKEENQDLNAKIKYKIPQKIEIGQWYPTKLIKVPFKRNYYDGEKIDFNGMAMSFTRYKKIDGKYEKEEQVVNYTTFKNGFKGWSFKPAVTKVSKGLAKNGKMRIKFSFILNNKDDSYK